MNRYLFERKFKSFAAFLIILILLPYIVSVFANGTDIKGSNADPVYVKVKVPNTEEADGVTEVEWTEYLAGILAKESGMNLGTEALKAQAIVIRTQIYREGTSSEDKILTNEYLTKEQIKDKLGKDFRKYYEQYISAVNETDDMVLYSGDSFAWTPFHQSSAGKTRSADEVLGTSDYPYIKVKDCPDDKEADNEIQVFTFSCEKIQEACRDFLVAEENDEKAKQGYQFEDFEIKQTDTAGYVSQLRIGNTICTGDQFRNALNLPSSCFSITDGGNGNVTITTTGIGHGLGMSLWTAGKMDETGKTYEEILSYFFEGTELKKDVPETDIF